jgi:hypothetical protein
VIALLAVALLFSAHAASAQDVGGKPVMQNVFFNVIWGSAVGATLGVAAAVIASSNKSAPSDARNSTITGATTGGVLGLGVALFLVYQGITFDPGSSTFTGAGGPPPLPPLAQLSTPPFMLITSRDDPRRITGFTARVLDLKF